MKSRKAQGLIISLLLFMVAMMMSIFVYLIMTVPGDNVVESQVDQEVNYQLGELRKRSTVTTTMNDYMWRSDEIGNDYGDYTAYEIISLYFSTNESEPLYIATDGGSAVEMSNSEVRNDIETYLKYKMDQYWQDGPNQIGYYIEIEPPSSTDVEPIAVRNPQDYEPGTYSRVIYPLTLADGNVAEITLWTQTSQNIYDVGVGSSDTDVPNVGAP